LRAAFGQIAEENLKIFAGKAITHRGPRDVRDGRMVDGHSDGRRLTSRLRTAQFSFETNLWLEPA
jgi:hypothetical protein